VCSCLIECDSDTRRKLSMSCEQGRKLDMKRKYLAQISTTRGRIDMVAVWKAEAPLDWVRSPLA